MRSNALVQIRRLAAAAVASALLVPASAQHQLSSTGYPAKIAGASDEAEKAIKRFQLPPGFKCEVWAAEPDLAQPVAFYMDDTGKVYVCETFRHSQGVDDIRGHPDWLDEELASKTVEDRVALLKRHFNNDLRSYTAHTERVRLLTDTHGLGRADHSTVFAEGFTNILDGIAAGVIARGNDVYLANIPNVWLLRDTDGDGIADQRKSLSYGYGVRGGFLGHDLHGFAWGPDGKLYYSIGDRAGNILVNGRYVGFPDGGSVFRCNADGSELEQFTYGLRNPQELVFDDFGNLFTGDNNSDGGDQARWTYLVEGADNGWRIGYQFLENRNSYTPRGPWNAEKMWYPQNPDQPAYIVPPIKNIAAGPSGVSYYPGTGATPEWRGMFTLVDFRGSSSGSGIHRFKLKPHGANFELVEADKMIWSILATDGDWGPDGAYYVLDWVEGWNQNGKGRIYKMTHEQGIRAPIVAETKKLLAAGFDQRSPKELLGLLAHPNQRVRQGAQFALAARGEPSLTALVKLARNPGDLHARVHAIWAIGQIEAKVRKVGVAAPTESLDALVALMSDAEMEVRANAARVLGDAVYPRAYEALVRAASDSNARVQSLAVIALSKLGRSEAVPAVLAMLKSNADADPTLRHAGVVALVRCASPDQIIALASNPSESLRLAAVIALRRLQRSEIALFLQDSSARIVVEAARAINDEPISGAVPDLALLIDKGPWNDLPNSGADLVRRIINANYRTGTRQSAAALAQYAAADRPEWARIDALAALGDWPANGGRDRITGLWRPTAFTRDAKIPGDALKPVLASMVRSAPNKIRARAARAAGSLGLIETAPLLAELAVNQQVSGDARSEALKALAALHAPQLAEVLSKAADDPDETVRKTALSLSAQVSSNPTPIVPLPAAANASTTAAPATAPNPLARFISVLAKGSISERQNALTTVAGIEGKAADGLLSHWMVDLQAGKVAPELQLDVLDAAARRPALKSMVTKWEEGLPKLAENDINPWKVCLVGGNADEGRKVFLEKAEVSCVRCHKIKGEGGEVGPELTGIVAKRGREYVLRSILYPNAEIAQGFESVLVNMKNGTTYAGVIKSETATELEVNSPEDGMLKLKKADITSREKGLSGMPEGFSGVLTKQEIRNLVEFLASNP